MVVLFGIRCRSQYTQPLGCQHDQWQTKNCEGFAAPAVDLTGCIPMGGHSVGKLIPQDNACQNGQQNDNGCDDQNFQIWLLKGILLSET